jgi:hypothetical protein
LIIFIRCGVVIIMKISLSEETFAELCDSHGGICVACGALKWEGCEPDACNYKCDECGKSEVFGAEEALLMEAIEISEDGK